MNPRPLGYEPNELPDCSTPRQINPTPNTLSNELEGISNPKFAIRNSLVGLGRVELPTSRLSGVRSNQLSYRPLRLSCASSAPYSPRLALNLCIPSIPNSKFQKRSRTHFNAKKSHTSLLRSVTTVDAPEGRVASVAIKLPAIYALAEF